MTTLINFSDHRIPSHFELNTQSRLLRDESQMQLRDRRSALPPPKLPRRGIFDANFPIYHIFQVPFAPAIVPVNRQQTGLHFSSLGCGLQHRFPRLECIMRPG